MRVAARRTERNEDGVRCRPMMSAEDLMQAGYEMSRPRRYECKAEFWTTPQQMDALEQLCADGLSDKATHLRQALAMYLRHFGIVAAPRPVANGKDQHQEHSHAV